MHKEVWLPALIDLPDVLSQEDDMVRADGSLLYLHVRFIRCSITFAVIAPQAGSRQIFP